MQCNNLNILRQLLSLLIMTTLGIFSSLSEAKKVKKWEEKKMLQILFFMLTNEILLFTIVEYSVWSDSLSWCTWNCWINNMVLSFQFCIFNCLWFTLFISFFFPLFFHYLFQFFSPFSNILLDNSNKILLEQNFFNSLPRLTHFNAHESLCLLTWINHFFL